MQDDLAGMLAECKAQAEKNVGLAKATIEAQAREIAELRARLSDSVGLLRQARAKFRTAQSDIVVTAPPGQNVARSNVLDGTIGKITDFLAKHEAMP